MFLGEFEFDAREDVDEAGELLVPVEIIDEVVG
jgi:hypothetical protein